VNIRDRIHFT